MEKTAKAIAEDAKREGYQVFCGLYDETQKCHQLFAVSGVDGCQLIRDFRVGSHNQGWADAEESEIRAVYKQMTGIYQVRPFRPYFVDAAGYHCTFEGQITLREAAAVERLLEVGLEWYAQHEWQIEDDDSPQALAPVIVKERKCTSPLVGLTASIRRGRKGRRGIRRIERGLVQIPRRRVNNPVVERSGNAVTLATGRFSGEFIVRLPCE